MLQYVGINAGKRQLYSVKFIFLRLSNPEHFGR